MIPVCPAFGKCGGCQYQDVAYADELALKEELLKKAIRAQVQLDDDLVQPVVPSPKIYHYRNRLDLKLINRRNGDVHIGFSSVERGPVVEVDACPIAMEAVSAFIPRLRQEAAAMIPKKYRMANLTVRAGDGDAVSWGGIGHGSLQLDARDYFYTDIAGKRVHYSLDTFFQANLSILPELIGFLRGRDIWTKKTVFFDLYGGVGLFSLGVSDLVGKAVNIEENVHAVRMAKYNISANGVANVEVVEGRVEDVLAGILRKEASPENVVMVDPPRAGLGAGAVALLNGLKGVPYVIYLSCNPESLAMDLKGLISGGWNIKLVRPFDFFPRTRHLETLVILNRG